MFDFLCAIFVIFPATPASPPICREQLRVLAHFTDCNQLVRDKHNERKNREIEARAASAEKEDSLNSAADRLGRENYSDSAILLYITAAIDSLELMVILN